MLFKVIKTGEIGTEKILGGPIKLVVTPETVGAKYLRFALGIFEPGEGLVPHIHPQSEEIYYVTHGKGVVYIGEERRETLIEPEIALYIPPGTIHEVKNTGDKTLVIAFFTAPGKESSKEVGE